MSGYQNIIDSAEAHCRERGRQLTEKRRNVLLGLVKSERALSAYELVDYYKENYDEALPAMSVYRILEFLENEQLVHKLKLANRYVACVHIACNHQHEASQFLICTDCQRVTEVTISKSTMANLRRTVTAAGYTMVSPQLEINCLCAACSKLQ